MEEGRAEETSSGGWLPIPVMEYVAAQLRMPYIRAYEVATFYLMFNTSPIGRYHLQVCTTTPCWLRGSDEVVRACRDETGIAGWNETSGDRVFTMSEVECLGACVNAPMVQINDDNYEDLDFDRMTAVLDALALGQAPTPGPQTGRRASCPEGGPTTLPEMVDGNHDYRGEWA